MKILLCLALCLAAAQASHIKTKSVTYSAGVVPVPVPVPVPVAVPAVHTAPATITHSTEVVAPAAHGVVGVGIGGHFVGAAYAAAPVVAASSVHTTVLKKEITLG